MNARKPLTPIQRRVLHYIRSYAKSNGYPPTRQEITNHFGWTGRNGAQQHLELIEKKGYIELTPAISRGIKVLDMGTA